MTDEVSVTVDGRAFTYRGERYESGEELSVDAETYENHPVTLELQDDDAEVESEASNADVVSGEPAAEADLPDEDMPDDSPAGYSRDELEEMDYSALRALAMDYEGDEIDGRSSRDEIVDTLVSADADSEADSEE